MSCGTKTLKITTFVLDFLCAIFGVLTIAACTYALIAYSQSNAIRVPCILAIVLGVLLALSTILGCVAALHENIRLTWIYVAILVALIFAQITVIFVQPVNYERLANETISNAWQRQLTENGTMTYYEVKYQCCGKTGPFNYLDSGMKIPASCYSKPNSNRTEDLYQTGCTTKLAIAFQVGTRLERISDWFSVGVEGFAVVVAGMFAITLQNIERRRLYR